MFEVATLKLAACVACLLLALLSDVSYGRSRGRYIVILFYYRRRGYTVINSPHRDRQWKARFILLTPTSRRQSAAQIFTHTNIWAVHTPAFAADDFTLTSIRRVGGSIRRVQSSWTPTCAGDNPITSQHPRSHYRVISTRYVIWGRSRLQQIIVAEIDATCAINANMQLYQSTLLYCAMHL